MSGKVDIYELKECIQLNSGDLDGLEEFELYIKKENGEILALPKKLEESIKARKLPEDINEWEIPDFEIGVHIEENREKYIKVPKDEYIDEEEIIKEFCWNYEGKDIGKKLKEAINKDDLMRGFKKAIYDNNVYDQWYDYFDKKCIENIEKWCKDNNLI